MAAMPVLASAAHNPLQVAAIDFGTTYSGYAFSFRSDFLTDPLKILTYKWESSKSNMVSLKAPSCVLFDSHATFHSFGYEAEDQYADLAADNKHRDWYFFKRFKMLLYENKNLNRNTKLSEENGKKMPAQTVFSACIRFLKDHLIQLGADKDVGLKQKEIHWVLTVPAIWDDSAKQFMREAAEKAGISSDHLTLALEPEAASLFCRHLPVDRVCSSEGKDAIACFGTGKQYLVLDAGGGTVDITVHETQDDNSVRELYKANGGPWGGTKVDEAFLKFLEGVFGAEIIEKFKREFKDDFIDMQREFEIKKKTISANMRDDDKIRFRIPLSVQQILIEMHGEDFRSSMPATSGRDVSFTGNKLTCFSRHMQYLFQETCDKIVEHLKFIFDQAAVSGTNTILMVGGFSESAMLQDTIRTRFSDKRLIIPAEAGLAVVMGAVIFGHDPTAITSRVAKLTYGVKIYSPFDPSRHPRSKKVIIKGKKKCKDSFSKHVEINQEVFAGFRSEEKDYWPLHGNQKRVTFPVYTSQKVDPIVVDGCTLLGNVTIDLSNVPDKKSAKKICMQMVYGRTEIGVSAYKDETGETINAKFDCLG